MGDCSLAEGQHPVESAGLNLTPFAGSVSHVSIPNRVTLASENGVSTNSGRAADEDG
jgi:hypothetical protein